VNGNIAAGQRAQAQDIVVGIPVFERAELTVRCVESVRATTPAETRIVVADDGTRSEQARSVLGSLSSRAAVEVLRDEKNRGPASAKNLILEAVGRSARVFAFLDNDIVAREGWLEAGVRALEDGWDLVQPLLLSASGDRADRGPNQERVGSISAHPEYLAAGAALDHPMLQLACPNAIVGGTFLARGEVFEKIGGFDPSLRVGEDYDLSFRAREAGFRLGFEPACRLVHDHRFDPGYDEVRANPGECLRSHWRMLEKHGRTLYCPRYFAWYRWLLRNREPMYLPAAERRVSPVRRLRRRLRREFYFKREGVEWQGVAEALSCARELASSMGWCQEARGE